MSKKTGASRDEVRYFERKGYISPEQRRIKQRWVREHTEDGVRLIALIVKYRRERFELDAAYEKAKEESKRTAVVNEEGQR